MHACTMVPIERHPKKDDLPASHIRHRRSAVRWMATVASKVQHAHDL
jgi:hypothetical protein